MEHSLKAIAVDREMAQISFALDLEALAAGHTRSRLEHAGARLGLTPTVVRRVLDDWTGRAKLMHAAHLIVEELRTTQPAARLRWWPHWLSHLRSGPHRAVCEAWLCPSAP
jgi:hypothetical protein